MLSVKVKIGSKGQFVIPKVIRDRYNINPGDEVIFLKQNNGLKMEKVKSNP